MRATRAYLASLGTTGLLVLAAVAVLLTASTLVAFNGWPGDNAADEAAPVVFDPGRDDGAPPTGPEQVAAAAAGAADAVGDATGGGDGRRGGDGPAGGGRPDPGGPGGESPDDPAPPAPGLPQTPADPAPPPGGGGPDPDPDPAPPPPPPRPTLIDGLADGVESATTFLGDRALTQVSPELGQVVSGTGQALTDIVRALDGAPPQRP